MNFGGWPFVWIFIVTTATILAGLFLIVVRRIGQSKWAQPIGAATFHRIIQETFRSFRTGCGLSLARSQVNLARRENDLDLPERCSKCEHLRTIGRK